jgi:hypothetical protein
MSTTRVSKVEDRSILEVQEDPETGELFIVFPESLLVQLGWREGDDIQWVERPDGNWTIQKVVKDEDE